MITRLGYMTSDRRSGGDLCWGFGRTNAEGGRIESTKAVGRGVPLPTGEGSEEGAQPLIGKIFDFWALKDEFCCILGAIFVVELNGMHRLVTFWYRLKLKSLFLKMMIHDCVLNQYTAIHK